MQYYTYGQRYSCLIFWQIYLLRLKAVVIRCYKKQFMSEMDSQNYFNMIVEMVCSNAGYERMVTQEMLADCQTYFNICHAIFGELRIKIVQIQENDSISNGQKLQQLIDLLIEQLQLRKAYEELNISGFEIVEGNEDHIFKFMQILFLYSNIFLENKKLAKKVRSQEEENNRLREKMKIPFNSARDPRKSEENIERQANQPNPAPYKPKYSPPIYNQPPNYSNNIQQQNNKYQRSKNYQHQQSRDNPPAYSSKSSKKVSANNNKSSEHYRSNNSSSFKEKSKKGKPKFNQQTRKSRSRRESNKNVFVQIARITMEQKEKMLQAATRDQRKGRLEQINHAKDAYKIYLQRFAKENRAQQNRQIKLKRKSNPNYANHELDIKDFDHIDNYFESFAYQLRDKKAAFIQKIKKLVHNKELERYYFQNRLERQLAKSFNNQLDQQLKRQDNQHRLKSQMIKQESKILQRQTESLKKELKQHNSKGKRELREVKMRQLKKIENVLNEDNDRMLMVFEDGRIEQLITQMYKRF